jgi:hypothetical protein
MINSLKKLNSKRFGQNAWSQLGGELFPLCSCVKTSIDVYFCCKRRLEMSLRVHLKNESCQLKNAVRCLQYNIAVILVPFGF